MLAVAPPKVPPIISVFPVESGTIPLIPASWASASEWVNVGRLAKSICEESEGSNWGKPPQELGRNRPTKAGHLGLMAIFVIICARTVRQ